MKVLRPFLFIASFIVLVGLACSLNLGNEPAEPARPSQSEATEESSQPSSSGSAINSLDELKDAVVQIEAVGTFVDPQVGLLVNAGGYGSGFIIDPSGIAVTNNHVVTGAATLKVFLNGEQYSARVLGASECADLAVIQIQGNDFKYLNWYSGDAKTGTEVYSAGFPLGEPQFTLTKGIVSKEKAEGHTNWASLDYVLSHDATINPGNSGGPLVSQNAQVIGVNYRSRPDFNQYFAIDSQTAQKMLSDLKDGKDVWSIGVNGTAVLSDDGSLSGIWVVSVKSGSPADKAGVRPGDILFQMEGLVLATDGTMKDYCDILRSRNASDTMSLTVIRFATNEILEGQLNGRELAVTGYFGDTGSSGSGDSNTVSSQGAFFTEQFSQSLTDEWTYEVIGSEKEKGSLELTDDALSIKLEGSNLFAYLEYTGYTYENVRIETRASNRGKNTLDIILICRASDEGWYEARVGSDGIYSINAFDSIGLIKKGTNLIANGGSKRIKTGREDNSYAFSCIDDRLVLEINGYEEKSIKDTRFKFKKGTVALGLQSFNVLPIIVNFDYFTIASP